ncbi:MAG: tripartite tricarboxylate transporter substrate-binding protein [Gammaproteobacteria bacterium]|nr:tripartite tricarboxylate transporter substrate-binding protein [Gammaproteobacteria bacterium]
MKSLRLLTGFIFIFCFSNMSIADWAPPGPMTMLIAFKAGGGADTQSRLIAEELEARHGWKIIPKQLTGKGGAVLAASMKDEPNDGSVIGIVISETFDYNMIAAKKAAYTQEDFSFLTTTSGFQMGVVAKTDKGWKTMEDVFSAAKAGEQIRFGAMSPKSSDLAYLLGKANDVEFNIVTTKGGKGTMNGLNAGDIDIGWGAGIQNKAVKAGDMVNLASGLPVPLSVSPDAPLTKDLGLPFYADGYFLFAAPAGIPDEARETITRAIVDIVTDESTKAAQFLAKAFGGSHIIQGADLDKFLAESLDSARTILKEVSE